MANPLTNNHAITRDHAVCFAEALAEELVEVEALRARRGINSDALTPKEIIERKHLSEIADKAGESERDDKEGKAAAEEAKFVVGQARGMELAGLAFSGGGIRSATFNLGVLQGLAQYNKVRAFDYLSTVSGGGYIGNWLEAWIKRSAPEQDVQHPAAREGIDAVEEELRPARTARPKSVELREWADQKSHTEPPPIRFLRDYSNYLTPRLGALGADTWTVIAIYLRNLFLNQSVLILFSFTLLLLPYIALWLTHALTAFFACPWLTNLSPLSFLSPWLAPIAVFLLLAGALAMGASNLKGLIDCGQPNYCIQQPHEGSDAKKKHPWLPPQDQRWVLLTIVAPIFLALWILTAWLWLHTGNADNWDAPRNTYWWPLWGMVLLGLPLCIASTITAFLHHEDNPYLKMLWWVSASLVTGAVSGLLMLAACREAFTPMHSWPGADWHQLSLGFPLTLLIFLAAATLKVGLMGRSFSDPYREWWARVAGWILILTIFWTAGFSVAIYAPLGLLWLRGWVKAAGLATWTGSTLAGVLGGKSEKTADDEPKSMTSRLLSFTPYVFIVGLLSLLSLSLELILARFYLAGDGMQAAWNAFLAESPAVEKVAGWVLKVSGNVASGTLTLSGTATTAAPASASYPYVDAHFTLLHQVTNGWLIVACLLVFVVCVWLSYRVDLNEFSMNLMYRNRLVRCYLGATHERRTENPFSGLDCRDDLFLSSLRSSQSYSGPLPILNSTLNLVNSRELAWQERKAESFPMTPFRCGFDTWIEQANLERDYQREKDEAHISKYAYRMTEQYAYKDGGFFVGTAMSISGAAASPNMGYHSTPSLAILMTFFNVRLGFWAGNPRNNDTWFLPGPTVGLKQLISELLGLTNDNAKYVYLSDGGHFENLGVYELVKRRCKFIIACDAGADPRLLLR